MPKDKVTGVMPVGNPLPGQRQPKRACAYVRVPAGGDERLDSLQKQTEYFERRITGDPAYRYCGIYSDACTPFSQEERPGFLQMMQDCREAKLDLIMVKSVSCFGRSVVDCVVIMRELYALGLGVLFEKESLYLEPRNQAPADDDSASGDELEMTDGREYQGQEGRRLFIFRDGTEKEA